VKHARHCPKSIDSKSECTCGGLNPVPPGLTVDGSPSGPLQVIPPRVWTNLQCVRGSVWHAANVPVTVSYVDGVLSFSGAVQLQGFGTPNTDSPYAGVDYARGLIQRADEAAEAGNLERAEFLRNLAAEARLLAELQGKWEY